MTERTTVVKAHSKYDVLRTSIPSSLKRQWSLKPGDELEWNWVVIDNKMVMTIKKAND
jgi:hypothetical protein